MEGTNMLEVSAMDSAGNEAVTSLGLVLDTSPPQAVVRLLINGQWIDPTQGAVDSRAKTVDLEVSLVEACSVNINVKGTLSLPAGINKVSLELVEGLNDIRLELRDLAGNRASPMAFQVLVDTQRPLLDLERADQVRTRDADFLVRGTTEAGCQVLIAGVPVGLLSDNSFSGIVHLTEGSNVIEVVSVDPAGNSQERNLEVELEAVKVGESGWGGTTRGLVIGLAIGMLLALGALGLWMRRRPAAPIVAKEPTYSFPDATPPKGLEVDRGVDEPETRESGQYPRAGVVRRRGR
jgi:hypothetical protein